MKSLVFVLLLLVAVNSTKWHQLENYSFEQYIQEFSKNYQQGTEEYTNRQQIFESNLAHIKSFNKDSSKTYKKGVNKFTDLTKEELKNTFGYHSDVHRAYEEANPQKVIISSVQNHGFKSLPAFVDWREKGIITTVKDQGMCGSCWAHGSVEQVESYTALSTGLLRTLSTQQMTSCAPNVDECGGTGGCNGSIPELAFDYVKANGLTTEWKASYRSWFGNSPACNTVLQTGTNQSKIVQNQAVFINGYVKLVPNSYQDVMYHLAFEGPLAVNVDASEWSSYEEGVYNGCSATNITIDHVVQLVGYGTDPQLGDYFLIRNSWDTIWGEKGYIRLKRDSQPNCGTDYQPTQGTGCVNGPKTQYVCGECGVLFDTSYPTGATISNYNATKTN